MSFDWSEYLTLAQEILAQQPVSVSPEARARAAISRAYSAAFLKCRNHLRDAEQITIPYTGKAHAEVIRQFKSGSGPLRGWIGHNLDRLRTDRRHADYLDSVAGIEKTAVADVQLAVSVLSHLSQL